MVFIGAVSNYDNCGDEHHGFYIILVGLSAQHPALGSGCCN
jgi:hypothetical protein